MFPNCIDRLGRQKRDKKQQQTTKNQGKNEQIKKLKNGNNSNYHEPLSEEWIGGRF